MDNEESQIIVGSSESPQDFTVSRLLSTQSHIIGMKKKKKYSYLNYVIHKKFNNN